MDLLGFVEIQTPTEVEAYSRTEGHSEGWDGFSNSGGGITS